jgi:hypothetical protein
MPYLGEFASLKDLETSNLFSNRFHGELAHKFASLSLGPVKTIQMQEMMVQIGEQPITLQLYLEKKQLKDKA